MSYYTTGEIAKLCSVSVRTVQYYDNRGVVSPTSLTEGGRRLYSEDDLSRMKIVCFLRELDIPLDSIAKLMKEENSDDVMELILDEQRLGLEEELGQLSERLERLKELQRIIRKSDVFSVESIGDVAHIMENKKKMRKLRMILLLTGIPVTVAEWVTVILWITTGIWWPFIVYTVVAVIYGIWASWYYFSRVRYICPQCHEIFKPELKKAFWAAHTPTTRKLTCPKCGHRGYCVETYRKENEE